MYSDLSCFTVVSITYNDQGISETIDSVEKLRKLGARHIVQNGGKLLQGIPESCIVYNEPDLGIYDALNKGLEKVETDFFMFLHAGDSFIGTTHDLITIINTLELGQKNLSINSQYIGKRLHSSRMWKPWMLNFGAQPPHLPTIYRTSEFKKIKYDLSRPIIADFHFFLKDVNWKNHINNHKILVQMSIGGETSSGLKSFFKLNKIYYQDFGVLGLVMIIARIPIKILQAIH